MECDLKKFYLKSLRYTTPSVYWSCMTHCSCATDVISSDLYDLHILRHRRGFWLLFDSWAQFGGLL